VISLFVRSSSRSAYAIRRHGNDDSGALQSAYNNVIIVTIIIIFIIGKADLNKKDAYSFSSVEGSTDCFTAHQHKETNDAIGPR